MKHPKIAELKNKLSMFQDDLHSMVFSEMPTILIVKQQAKIRAMKSVISVMRSSGIDLSGCAEI
jgi:hypothetical protein